MAWKSFFKTRHISKVLSLNLSYVGFFVFNCSENLLLLQLLSRPFFYFKGNISPSCSISCHKLENDKKIPYKFDYHHDLFFYTFWMLIGQMLLGSEHFGQRMFWFRNLLVRNIMFINILLMDHFNHGTFRWWNIRFFNHRTFQSWNIWVTDH